jgi:DNA polymerase III delta prime subunit
LKESDIIKRLQWLAVKESLDVDKDAFSVIASRADGSLRDAEMILDQLSLLDKTISSDMVRELVSFVRRLLLPTCGFKKISDICVYRSSAGSALVHFLCAGLVGSNCFDASPN